MKWIALILMSVVLTACGYNSAEFMEYRQVSVTPVVTTRIVNTHAVNHCCNAVVTTPVVSSCCNSMVTVRKRCCPTATPAVIRTPSCCGTTVVTSPSRVYSSTTVLDSEPIDVTASNVEYY
jgi:hypothetical protein